jgi:hypothetical protein
VSNKAKNKQTCMNNLRTELWLRESSNQNRLTAQGAFSVASPKKLLGQDTNKKCAARSVGNNYLSWPATWKQNTREEKQRWTTRMLRAKGREKN